MINSNRRIAVLLLFMIAATGCCVKPRMTGTYEGVLTGNGIDYPVMTRIVIHEEYGTGGLLVLFQMQPAKNPMKIPKTG